jgi:tryptophan-rich sensory protein
MTPVELALAIVWGVLFALFAYDRWKTRKEPMKDDDSY